MKNMKTVKLLLMAHLLSIGVISLLLTVCMGGKISKSEALPNIIKPSIIPNNGEEIEHVFSSKSRTTQNHGIRAWIKSSDITTEQPIPSSNIGNHTKNHWYENWPGNWIPIIIGIGFFCLFTYFVGKRAAKLANEKEILKSIQKSPFTPPQNPCEEVLKGVCQKAVQVSGPASELVFFVEEHERFKLEDLLEATADLRSQKLCSSLFKVVLNNNAYYAVKRLKKLQVSFEEFGRTMREIGNLKHPNLLRLVGYNSSNEEKLLIYKYQSNGSLLDLLESFNEGKIDFPWRLRVSIVTGIARGLNFIYNHLHQPIPHGNLKLSNILLNENNEPLISEYGITKFLDPKGGCLLTSKGYIAPEKTLSEKADVYSFGIILLELLTGKTVEKSGIDLPKWVRAMVREEWTGEVFDKEVGQASKQYWSFALLNVALKCVLRSAEDRPRVGDVVVRIEEVVKEVDEDCSYSSVSYDRDDQEEVRRDESLIHSVILEVGDTPGSFIK